MDRYHSAWECHSSRLATYLWDMDMAFRSGAMNSQSASAIGARCQNGSSMWTDTCRGFIDHRKKKVNHIFTPIIVRIRRIAWKFVQTRNNWNL